MDKHNKKQSKKISEIFNMEGLKKMKAKLKDIPISDIFYIGRGEFWIKKRGVIGLQELEKNN